MAATARVGGSGPSLIADIGGTNVRFALVEGAGDPSHIRKSKVAEFPSFSEALGDYLSAVPDRPSAAMIAVAGPVSGGAATLTNADWTITAADVNAHLPGVPVRLMNDFEAVALALPHLAPSEWQTLGPRPSDAPSLNAPLPKLALGAGTGLGTCLLVPIPGGGWLTVPAEGGHRSLDPSLLAALPAPGEGPPPTALEHLVSGRGLLWLAQGFGHRAASPEEVVKAARAGERAAQQAIGLFFDVYAEAAQAIALTTGAIGGVVLAGGITPSLLDLFDQDRFAHRFRHVPTLPGYLTKTPLVVVTAPDPAFIGLANARI